jgi:hypothetical protein
MAETKRPKGEKRARNLPRAEAKAPSDPKIVFRPILVASSPERPMVVWFS